MAEPSHAVFLSYASQDVEAARRICGALRAAGIEVWFDQSELRGGDAWDRKIRDQIRHCALFIPIISAHSEARLEGYFRREWKIAVERKRDIADEMVFLLPVVIDETPERGASVPEGFHEVQWTRLPGGATSQQFIKHISGLLTGPPHRPSPGVEALQPSPASAPPRLAADSKSDSRVRIWLPLIAIAAAVIVAYIGIDRFLLHEGAQPSAASPAPAKAEKSIAVLPFVDMSEKHDQEYFADGMAEELLDQLARTPGLKVIARTSSFYFKGKQATVEEIGHALGVENLLEGSIRKSGNRLRVTTQLVRADTGEHVWSETYERELTDIFKLQDEITASIVGALRMTLTGGVSSRRVIGTTNLDAYELYLQGLSESYKNTSTSMAAVAHFAEEAINRDPNFALAYHLAAFSALQLTDNGYLPAKVGYERARVLELEALKRDPNLYAPHASLAYIHQVYDWDWEAATAEVQTALRANPIDEGALRIYGQLALTMGKADEAVRYFDASLSRNPLDTYALWARGHALYISSRYAESEQTYRRLLEIEPQFSWAHSYLAKTLIALGRPGDALVVAQQEPEEENRLDILAIAFDAAGRRQEADTSLDTLIKKYGASDAYYVAMTYANRGDNDRAIEWLNRAYSQRDPALWEITHEPLFKSLAHDSRFKAFLRKMNLPE